MSRRVIIIGVVIVIVIAVFLFFRRRSNNQTAAAVDERAATIDSGTIEVWVTGTGEIAPAAQAGLSFSVPGNVGEVQAEVGDLVRSGDVLIELDLDSLDPSLVNAVVELIVAEQELQTLLEPPDELELAAMQRARDIAEQNLIIQRANLAELQNGPTAEEIAAAEAELAAAQAAMGAASGQRASAGYDIQLAQINLEQAQRDLDRAQTDRDEAWNEARDWEQFIDKPSCLPGEGGARPCTGEPPKDRLKRDREGTDLNLIRAKDNLAIAQTNYNIAVTGVNESGTSNAEAQAAQAEANLANLLDGASAEQLTVAKAQVAIAEAELSDAEDKLADLLAGADPDDIAAAEARLRAAEAQANQTRLTAPFNATVMAVNYQVGDSVTPGQAAIVLADTSRLHIDTLVDELDVAMVSIGQDVEMTVDALSDVNLVGRVAEIDLVPASDTSTTEYPVKVDLESDDEPVRVGMTAALNILVAQKEDVFLVPNWALRLDPDTGEVYVTVQSLTGSSRRPVTLGLRNETNSEVVDGLKQGDVVSVAVTPEPSTFQGPFGGGD